MDHLLICVGTALLIQRNVQKQPNNTPSRPTVDLKTVQHLLSSKYGISGNSHIKDLPSYDDLNFHIVLHSGEEFVLKFNLSTAHGEDLRLENIAMQHLSQDANDPTLTNFIPKVMPLATAKDANMFVHQADSGRTYYVRLLTYMKGSLLAHVPFPLRTHALLHSVGSMLGRCDRSFANHPTGRAFPTKYTKIASERDHFWDLRNAMRLEELSTHVAHPNDRALLQQAFQLFHTNAHHLLQNDANTDTIRRQVTHNDGNDHNIIVQQHAGENGATSFSLVGLIDFGDLVHTSLVCNLAISLAYCCCNPDIPFEQSRRRHQHSTGTGTAAVKEEHNNGENNALLDYALNTAVAVVEGYQQEMPLTLEELNVLWWCMVGRICHSLASSAHRQTLEPDNAYLTVSEQPFWKLLYALSYPSFETNAVKATTLFKSVLR